MNRNIIALIFLLLMQIPAMSGAADSVFVPPGANGVFYVKCADFINIDGVEIELSYDTTALANPRITQGAQLASTNYVGNPKFAANKVKIVASSLINIKCTEVGNLAILNFDLKGQSQGVVTVSKKILSKSLGAPVTGSDKTLITDKSDKSDKTDKTVKIDTAGITVSGISLGTITLPQDQLAATDKKTEYQPLVTDLRKDMTLPIPGADGKQGVTKASAAADGKQADKKSVAYKGVPSLFKEFKGERSSQAFIALFAEAAFPDYKQEPPIVIADGVTPLKLTLKLKPTGNESPKFILNGANVQQLRAEGEDYTWIVDAIPKKGVTEAKLTVLDGPSIMEFPLVVAPLANTALTGAAKTTEADFTQYLANPAKYDLNKDGKNDFLDDFIYTANYIVTLKIKPEKLLEKDKKAPATIEKKVEKKSLEPVKPPDTKVKATEKPAEKPLQKDDAKKAKTSTKKPVKKPAKKSAANQDKKPADKAVDTPKTKEIEKVPAK